MTGPIVLNPGASVHVAPPVLPSVTVAPPDPNPVGAVVVPVVGPRGPQGPGADDLGLVQTMIDTTVQVHVVAPEPHPVYDDLPSLRLLFENGLI